MDEAARGSSLYLVHRFVAKFVNTLFLAILCAGVTVWKAIKQSNTKPGDYLLVSGAYMALLHYIFPLSTSISDPFAFID